MAGFWRCNSKAERFSENALPRKERAQFRSVVGDFAVKPFGDQRVQRAIRFHGRDSRIQLAFQLTIAFANADANAAANGDVRASEDQLTTGILDKVGKEAAVSQNSIRLAVFHSGDGVVWRREFDQRSAAFSDV